MNKIISLLLQALIVSSTPKVNELTTYIQNFAYYDEVISDFEAYYVYTLGGRSEEDTIYNGYDDSARWYVENNTISRKSLADDIYLEAGTNSIGVLTYTKQKYTNFELEVEYKMGSLTYFWPVIGFRQTEKGKYYLSDGAGAYFQSGGMATLWGTDGVGGPYEAKSIPGYENNTWHKLKIRVEGVDFAIYADKSETPAMEKKLPESFFRKGYISLISVNNDCSFRNLIIKELEVKPLEKTPSQEAALDDSSSDALLVIGEKVEEINELDYVIKPVVEEEKEEDNKDSENKVDEKEEKTGCNANAGSLISLLGLALFILKKKK